MRRLEADFRRINKMPRKSKLKFKLIILALADAPIVDRPTGHCASILAARIPQSYELSRNAIDLAVNQMAELGILRLDRTAKQTHEIALAEEPDPTLVEALKREVGWPSPVQQEPQAEPEPELEDEPELGVEIAAEEGGGSPPILELDYPGLVSGLLHGLAASIIQHGEREFIRMAVERLQDLLAQLDAEEMRKRDRLAQLERELAETQQKLAAAQNGSASGLDGGITIPGVRLSAEEIPAFVTRRSWDCPPPRAISIYRAILAEGEPVLDPKEVSRRLEGRVKPDEVLPGVKQGQTLVLYLLSGAVASGCFETQELILGEQIVERWGTPPYKRLFDTLSRIDVDVEQGQFDLLDILSRGFKQLQDRLPSEMSRELKTAHDRLIERRRKNRHRETVHP